MDGVKSWLKSQTIFGGVAAVVGGAGMIWKAYATGTLDPSVIMAGSTAIWGGVTAIIGRVKATTVIGKPAAPVAK